MAQEGTEGSCGPGSHVCWVLHRLSILLSTASGSSRNWKSSCPGALPSCSRTRASPTSKRSGRRNRPWFKVGVGSASQSLSLGQKWAHFGTKARPNLKTLRLAPRSVDLGQSQLGDVVGECFQALAIHDWTSLSKSCGTYGAGFALLFRWSCPGRMALAVFGNGSRVRRWTRTRLAARTGDLG